MATKLNNIEREIAKAIAKAIDTCEEHDTFCVECEVDGKTYTAEGTYSTTWGYEPASYYAPAESWLEDIFIDTEGITTYDEESEEDVICDFDLDGINREAERIAA